MSKHRAPRHRADVEVDSCTNGFLLAPCDICADYTPRATHRSAS